MDIDYSDLDRIASSLISARFESDDKATVKREGGRIRITVRDPGYLLVLEDIENGFKKILDIVYNVGTRAMNLGIDSTIDEDLKQTFLPVLTLEYMILSSDEKAKVKIERPNMGSIEDIEHES